MDTTIICHFTDPEKISMDDSYPSDVDNMQVYQKKDVDHKQSTSSHGVDSVADLGFAITGILDSQDVSESLPGQFDQLDRVGICHPEADMCRELTIDLAESESGTYQKDLKKALTFPCSKDASVGEKMETSCMGLHGENFSGSREGCMRSISLPTPSRLVPAMKGSREKGGESLRKMRVTWAPDVYDPPVTSLSHTVNSHNQQRRRTNKKNGKHKHKGKSSRGSTSGKKQSRAVANSDPRSNLTASSGTLHLDGFNQPTAELVEVGGGQESNCGGGFPGTSVAQMHVSVGDGFNQPAAEVVGGQESNCGGSFLRTSVAEMPVSVAEAT